MRPSASLTVAGSERSAAPGKQGLRIAWCQPVPGPAAGGEASFYQQTCIAKGLQARGHAVTLVAPSGFDDLVHAPGLKSPVLVPRTWSGTRLFTFSRKAAWRAQQCLRVPYLNVFSNYSLLDACLRILPGYDVVHERNGLYKAGVAMACKRLQLPYLLFFDADEILEHDLAGRPLHGILRWRARRIIRFTLQTADGIVCVTTFAKQHLARAWGVPPQKVAVFPNGVDVERYRPYPEHRTEIRSWLGTGDAPLIVFAGTFQPWHDIKTLLHAFAGLLESDPRALLALVGDGETRGSMAEYARSLGVGRSVRLTGAVSQDEVARVVSAADVAVCPSPKVQLWGSPMKLFEYMASGTALVASDLPQIAEVVQDGVNGLLVPPGDAPALRVALKRLIDDPALSARLGRRAREDAVRNHSWDRYASRLERVYRAVIRRQPIGQL